MEMSRALRRRLALPVAALFALCALVGAPAGAQAAQAAQSPAYTELTGTQAQASSTRMLLAGQDNVDAWTDMAESTGATPDGGSVYYSVADGGFTGACEGGGSCDSDLQFLGQRGAAIGVGVDWKDDPPGWDGQEDDEQQASQQATEQIAEGQWDAQFDALVAAIEQYPSSTFYLRLDYEVSTAYDCLGGTDCSSYVDAFQHLVTLIRGESGAGSGCSSSTIRCAASSPSSTRATSGWTGSA